MKVTDRSLGHLDPVPLDFSLPKEDTGKDGAVGLHTSPSKSTLNSSAISLFPESPMLRGSLLFQSGTFPFTSVSPVVCGAIQFS